MVKEFSLSKKERLSGRKAISSLFETGYSIYVPPLKIIYQVDSQDPYLSVMAVSVPKRLYKKAVDRNLLKRRIREAYRLNKPDLHRSLQMKQRNLTLVIQYQHKEILSFKTIAEATKAALFKVVEQLK